MVVLFLAPSAIVFANLFLRLFRHPNFLTDHTQTVNRFSTACGSLSSICEDASDVGLGH